MLVFVCSGDLDLPYSCTDDLAWHCQHFLEMVFTVDLSLLGYNAEVLKINRLQ